jgi:imidazolonepropionase-like amidohydrolase
LFIVDDTRSQQKPGAPMKHVMNKLFGILAACLIAGSAQAQDPKLTLIRNVNIFDGKSKQLAMGQDVLIEGNLIKQIGTGITAAATIIDGGGRTLMPGLIDMHTHLMYRYGVTIMRNEFDAQAAGAAAMETLQLYMQMGYTTVRDVGGNSLGLAHNMAAGRLKGPRIYSSGGAVSPISGHNDLAMFSEAPASDVFTARGDANIITGPIEAREAVRTLLRSGASQIKIMVGGGVASNFDPLEATTMAEDEIRAIVEAAADFGTYACAHAYTDDSVNRVLDAGGRCIEHGFLVSEKTLLRMKELDAVMSLQPYAAVEIFKEPEKLLGFNAENQRKARQVRDGADQMLKWVAQHDVPTFAGADLWQEGLITKTPDDMALRKRWFPDVEILRQNTSSAAKWLAKSGTKNPYREGPLGVIEEGAYADMLLVEGNPVADVTVMADWKNNIKLIMKDGEIYKNTL